MSRILISLCFFLSAGGCVSATANDGTQHSLRQIEGNAIVSSANPAAVVTIPETASFLGSSSWRLYDVADAEIYIYAEAGPDDVIDRLYWIQFEAYIPERPGLSYDYESSRHDTPRTIAGRPFFVRARFGEGHAEAPQPGSDAERMREIVAAAGLRLPDATMNVRFVHLPDPSRRSEMLIIYLEDLRASGTPLETLIAEYPGTEAWGPIAESLTERALDQIGIELTSQN